MKTFKRFSAILLAALMLVAMMAAPASAATTHSITISGAAGHTFEAYQIFTGTLSGAVLSDIVWGDGVDSEKEETSDNLLDDLKASDKFDFATLFASCTDAADIAKILEDTNKWNEAKTIAFAEIVAAQTTTNQGVGAESGTDYVISGLEPGYYILKDTTNLAGENDANSRYMIQLTKDTAVEIKEKTPTFKKFVSLTGDNIGTAEAVNAAISNTVYFSLTATLHDRVGDYVDYNLQFVDTLPDCLTDPTVVAVYVNSTKLANTDAVTKTGEGNTVTFTVEKAEEVISAATNGASISSTDSLTVVFAATLTGNNLVYGSAGNTNSAYLKFSNNPYNSDSMGQTTEDTAKVYSYQLVVDKQDSSTQTSLSGAEFVIHFLDDNGNTKYVEAEGTNGDYTVKNIVDSEAAATKLVTNGSGQFTLKGLRHREYHLVETTAPAGYNKIPVGDEQKVTIIPSLATDGSLNSLSASRAGSYTTLNGTPDASTGTVSVIVINHQGAELPSTGGIGTTIFYGIGGVLVLGALSLLIVRKRSTAK